MKQQLHCFACKEMRKQRNFERGMIEGARSSRANIDKTAALIKRSRVANVYREEIIKLRTVSTSYLVVTGSRMLIWKNALRKWSSATE
ncbi:hypothetical protein TNCV_2197531 [Trichonephila clavipes]|nr:hypothetical protein TNCV_2197531 [Trichonephila clavipes]